MAAMSEACPVCGCLISNEAEKAVVTEKKDEQIKVFHGLVETLRENLSLQENDMSREVITSVDYSRMMDENGTIGIEYQNLNIKPFEDNLITSCLLSSTGDELTPSIHTNLLHLIVLFTLDKEEQEKLQELSIASRFTHYDDGEKQLYYADCGDNVDEAAYLFSAVLQTVIGTSYEAVTEYNTIQCFLKEDERKNRLKWANKGLSSLKAHYSLPNDTELFDEIRKKVEKYNVKADKYNYDRLILDAETKTLTGIFVPKKYTEKMGFVDSVKIDFRNGDIEGDFKDIMKMCSIR